MALYLSEGKKEVARQKEGKLATPDLKAVSMEKGG
jgi:hypothetical protein